MKYFYKNENEIDLKKTKIVNDPNLSPEERETHFYITGDDEYAEIDAAHPAWIKHLLNHPEFTPDDKGIVTTLDKNGNEVIVGVKGKIPRNCIRTSLKPRERFDKL